MLLQSLSIQAGQHQAYDRSRLSTKGQIAYHKVKKASCFSIGPTGYAGQPSDAERAVNLLMNEQDAVESLKSLLREASAEGQLYALYGLYFKDRVVFKQAVDQLEKQECVPEQSSGIESVMRKAFNQPQVATSSGCIILYEYKCVVIRRIQIGFYAVPLGGSPTPPQGETHRQ